MTTSLPRAGTTGPSSSRRRRQWLSVVSHTDPRYGGLSTAVPRMGTAVSETGRFDVSLAAFCAPGEQVPPAGYDEAHLSFWPASRLPWLTNPTLARQFRAKTQSYDGLHIHGLWEASTAAAARTARDLGKPYILSAHGMLEPWALTSKRLKKLLYARFVERDIVTRAACLHALTRAEAGQYREFGARGPIAVVPNAVEVPEVRSPELFFGSYPQLRERRVVLFLGRLHPKKGLDLLVEAWAVVSKQHPEAHLVLAGPDAENTQVKLLAVITAHGIGRSITFTGMMGAAMKWSALAAAEVFVLPSYSEGLSMGVLEALGAGVPVIVTRNCNMPEVTGHGAGWEIEANQEELTQALLHLLGREPAENQAMGERGSYLVTTRYNPSQVAREMADVYDFAMNGIPTTNAELLIL